MPKASIVIPCYNAERFVEESVASAQAQVVRDIEIICVDDGSNDKTLAILKQLAAKDERIRVLEQPNGGEGPARDAGLCAATGDWLYFLDADDIMGPNLLEEAIACGEREQADVVVFRTTMLDDQTGEQYACEWSFKHDWLEGTTFCPREHPEHVFNSFQNWVHNKLFRGSFVREHNLHMQHVHRTADLLFTCRALAEAERIALLDMPLYLYRVNNAQSAMATSDLYPLDFFKAFVALRAALEESGAWPLYHDSFVNWTIEGIAVNLRYARSYETYRAIADHLEREGFEQLDIVDFPREKSDMPNYYDQIRPLVEGEAQQTLFRIAEAFRAEQATAQTSLSAAHVKLDELTGKLEEAQEQAHDAIAERDERIAELEAELEEQRHTFACVTSSTSFRIGRAATFVPRTVVGLLRRRS